MRENLFSGFLTAIETSYYNDNLDEASLYIILCSEGKTKALSSCTDALGLVCAFVVRMQQSQVSLRQSHFHLSVNDKLDKRKQIFAVLNQVRIKPACSATDD